MSAATTDKPRTALAERPSLPRIDLRQVDLSVPSIEIGSSLNASVEFAPRPVTGSESNGIESSPTLGGVFEANQVEKQVSLIGSATPRYPEVLRASGVEGRVTAEFVVDERGRAEADSVRFVGSDNQLFEEAVKAVLPRMRFAPAEVGGRKVRQLVRMPFVFTLGR
jgi:protein TonB